MHFLRFAERAEILAHGELLDGLEHISVLLQHGFGAGAQGMLGGDFLCFVRVQVVQISLGQITRALLLYGALHHGHRVLRHDGGRGVYGFYLALAKFTLHRHHFRFKRDQHVANIALQEDGGGITAALAQHGDVLVQVFHKSLRISFCTTVFQHRAPGCQIGVATIPTGLGIDHHHLDVRACQVFPILDVLGVTVTHQEQHGRRGGRCIVRELLGPVFADHAVVGQEFNVGGGVESHHISGQTVIDCTRLGAGATVRLVNLDILACGLLVVVHEGLVVVLVELTCHVIRDIEQLILRAGHATRGQCNRCQQRLELQRFHGVVAFVHTVQ